MDDIDIPRKCYVARDCSTNLYSVDYLKNFPRNSRLLKNIYSRILENCFLLTFIRLCLQKPPPKCKIVSTMLNHLKNTFHVHHDGIFYVLKEEFSKNLVPMFNDSNIIGEFFFEFNIDFEDIPLEDRTIIEFFSQIALTSKQIFFKRLPSGDSFVDTCIMYNLLVPIEVALCFSNASRWSERHHHHNYRVVTNMM
ncbi:hypothetical protein TNCT_321891 [Trichonephila clavata]|uniref:Uncharacterized protein n=1 Tax=Trichonephila clavata TaxID=2740835 RepID=A0A8X6FDV4_TRICU|nr:hypothetical protein TNCT_321891 [Trichonephila clavata]